MAISNMDNRLNEAVDLINQNEQKAVTFGSGITSAAEAYHATVRQDGTNVVTEIYIDLTGLTVAATDGDIIGDTGAANCHLGQVTAAVNGTVDFGYMQCLEAPATGNTDIDLYSADEGTGTEDTAISALTENALVTAGGAWAVGDVKPLTAFPAADEYLYLTNGAAAGAGTYTAGRFKIVLVGTAA